ncbi:MAG: hypothetical protein R2809_04600 [Flavobacteriales bacterium]
MLDVPFGLVVFFIVTTLLFYFGFIWAMLKGSERVQKRVHVLALAILAWLIFQSTLTLNRWYMDREAMPPHIMFPVLFMFAMFALLAFTPRGKRFLNGLSLEVITWLHLVRIPVEIALYWLAFYKQAPWSMTFYGHNYDIVFGITAPIIAYFGIRKKKISPVIIKVWNILGVVSLLIIMITAAGATATKIQAWDFDRPNYAITHFPFSWLPSFIAPMVLLAHIKALFFKGEK